MELHELELLETYVLITPGKNYVVCYLKEKTANKLIKTGCHLVRYENFYKKELL